MIAGPAEALQAWKDLVNEVMNEQMRLTLSVVRGQQSSGLRAPGCAPHHLYDLGWVSASILLRKQVEGRIHG